MLEIVQTPLARRMWRISKFFKIPLNDKRMQELTTFDLDFYELSMIADDPKKLEQLKNHYYDPEFDDWLEEFDEEQSKKQNTVEMPDSETIEWSNKNRSEEQDITFDTDYEVSMENNDISDWEEVE